MTTQVLHPVAAEMPPEADAPGTRETAAVILPS